MNICGIVWYRSHRGSSQIHQRYDVQYLTGEKGYIYLENSAFFFFPPGKRMRDGCVFELFWQSPDLVFQSYLLCGVGPGPEQMFWYLRTTNWPPTCLLCFLLVLLPLVNSCTLLPIPPPGIIFFQPSNLTTTIITVISDICWPLLCLRHYVFCLTSSSLQGSEPGDTLLLFQLKKQRLREAR